MIRTQPLCFILLGCVFLAATPWVQAQEKTPDKPKVENSDWVQELTRRVRPSIVVFQTAGREGGVQGIGTGFIISADGLVVTNLHVIGEGREFTIQTADGKKLPVLAVHASNRQLDLAVIRVDAKELPALELGDSAAAMQGEPVIVLGNPHGLKHSVVSGVISGRRELEDRQMLQLAIPIEPGNSGGPVVDRQGRVLGVVTMKSAVTENLGFAVEVNSLKPLLEKPNSVVISKWLTIGALDTNEWKPLFGSRWTQRAGRILVSGLGQGFGGRSLCLATKMPPKVPFEVGVAVKLNDEAGAAGLAFHADGGDRHYGFYPTNGKFRLTRFDGSDVFQWKVLEEKASPAYRPGEFNHLRVRIEQDKFLCYVNDELLMESTDQGLTSGQVGLAKFRQTEAEFKRFQVGEKIGLSQPPAAELAVIRGLIDQLPSLAETQPKDWEPLVAKGANSVSTLRLRAKETRQRAEELERSAADVHVRLVTEELAKVVAGKESEINLLRAALVIANLDEEEIDVDAYVQYVGRMAEKIRGRFAADADEAAKLAALHKFLFDEEGYHGSRLDYYNAANSYLNRVIDDREGIPITLAVLYLDLARQLGLKFEGVGLPGHFVVRHLPAKGQPQLIDVFEGGVVMTKEDAANKVMENTGKPIRDEHLQGTAPRAILVRMLNNLLAVAQRKGDREAMLRYVEGMIAVDPSLVRERGLRAMVRFETGRREAAIADLDWFLENKPDGIDLEQIRGLQNHFRTRSPK